MAQEFVRVSTQDDLGNVEINRSVFESIILIALDEFKKQLVVAESGFKKGVSFNQDKDGLIKVEVNIKVFYGQNAERVSRQVQKKVYDAILQMTDVACDQIDVFVLGFQLKA